MLDPIIIGQADGPTSLFLAGKLGGGWINIFGLCMVIAILIPNIIYAVKFRDGQNKCTNKGMNIIEQIGRYACMILLVLNIGKEEFGFFSPDIFVVHLVGNILLLLVYWVMWMLYFVKQAGWKSMVLATVPVVIFLLNGITLQHVPLVIAAVVFGVGHIYVTWQNTKSMV
nr:hypothetical protein [Lachnospiraceae bacterium]